MKQKKNDSYVITGIGVVTPAGCSYEALSASLRSKKSYLKDSALFADKKVTQKVGVVEQRDLCTGLTIRQTKRLDKFTIFSIVAAKQALQQSSFVVDESTNERIGIIVGNSLGGWSYVEPQLYGLCQGNPDAINPYVATAWFPTAPQGEISILMGIKGFSKTITSEKNSGGNALEYAIDLLEFGYLDAVLVGGIEAPLTPLVYNAFLQSRRISPLNQYLPFHQEADGTLLGEGGGFLFIEKSTSATRRNAEIYGEILSIGKGSSMQESMEDCINKSEVDRVDYIILDAAAVPEEDEKEYEAIESLFSNDNAPCMSAPKTYYGNLLAGSMIVDIALACSSLSEQYIVPTCSTSPNRIYPRIGNHIFSDPIRAGIETVLINSKDNYGQCMSVLIGK